MPTYKEIHITTGWKNEINKRFGPAVVVQFRDEKTGKLLFSYAPTCEDEQYWVNFFKVLKEYDGSVKALRAMNAEGVSE